MTFPKISIITPSYNQGHFIEETIQSVLNQGYPNLEYIIIDGGSTDNTVEVIKKYEKHLHYWVSEKDKGQSDAINKGYQQTSGEIINWLNSDDYYEPGALFKVAAAFADPNINVYCGISHIFGNGADFRSSGTDVYAGNPGKTAGWARIDQPETFFRKSAWEAIGGIDLQFHYLMDREFWTRYLLRFGQNGINKSQELLVHFRLHGDSKTVSQQAGFRQEGINYYYSLALDFGLEKEAGFIKEFFKTCTRLTLMPVSNPKINPQVLIHNYFWFQVSEAYAQNDPKRFDFFSRVLQTQYLEASELPKLKSLKFRQKMVPMAVKKLWNKYRAT